MCYYSTTLPFLVGKKTHWLCSAAGFADCSDVLPVYIGDDRTDEDAFKVNKYLYY